MTGPLRRVGLLQQWTPLLLVLLALGVWAEPLFGDSAPWQGVLGESGLLRLAVGLLCFYMLLQIAEQQRLRHDFMEVIRTMQETLKAARGQDGSQAGAVAPTPTADPAQQRAAMGILIQSLATGDERVRAASHEQLVRLVGEDLGGQPGPWQAWLERSGG